MSMSNFEGYNDAPVIVGKKAVWFLNGDLVRVYHISRANGIMSVYNMNTGNIESCLYSDFKKHREKAYSVVETSLLVNRHRKYLPTLMKSGKIPYPVGGGLNKQRGWQIRAYYSESQVYEIRDILATHSMGRPRKDGLINNNVTPTHQELTRRLGNGILTYTKNSDGAYIPIWAETL
jgi:hypothetical protein